MMKRQQRLLAASALAALLVSGPALAAGLKLGALMPLTGGLEAYGQSSLNGVQMAADEVNADGGVLGGKVDVKVGDTQTKAQPAIDAAKKLVSIEGVSGLIGALSSGNTIPVALSVSKPDQVPQISPASTAPTITTLDDGDFLFRTVPSDAFQGVALAQVVHAKGTKKVAILYTNNDYGDGLAKSFSAAFEKLGGEVTTSNAYEPNKASYRGELDRVAKGGPQALLLIGYPDDGGTTILRQSLEEGYFNHFIFTDGMKARKIISAIGAQYLDGSYGTAPKAPDTPGAETFKQLYTKKFGQLPPRPYIDSSYDAAAILILAAAEANSDNGVKIRDAIRKVTDGKGVEIHPGELVKGIKLIGEGKKIKYIGAAGDEAFDQHGDVSGTYEHWAIKDGKLVTVKIFKPQKM